MADKTLIDMHDLARENTAATEFMTYLDTQIGVGARDGRVLVWLVEDTTVEKEFDVADLKPKQFQKEVDAFLRDAPSN